MGGYGSTRWALHTKKTTVEDCHKLTMSALTPYLRAAGRGSMSWTRGGRPSGSISFAIIGNDHPEAIRLMYTLTDRAGIKTERDYTIQLTHTLTPWGARRYWFTCPLAGCGRRVGVLYLPPGGSYFGCRHCYNLTYTSAQEAGKYKGLYNMLAQGMQDTMPGATAKDIQFLLDHDERGQPPRGGYYDRLIAERINELLSYDPYPGYLTPDELRAQSGLTPDNLAALEAARLLLPDHGGRYRPKLAGWGRKLAHLLGEGWTIDELKAWARGRWSTPNPRAWPPDLAAWRCGDKQPDTSKGYQC